MTLRGGREALVRLLVTALSVAIGVGLLLSVLAMYHAYRDAVAKPCWQCTNVSRRQRLTAVELQPGRVRRPHRAAPRRRRPSPPAVRSCPACPRCRRAGQYYASPALAALLRAVPADELAARFPGTLAGTIGPAGLQSPDDLAIVIGHTPSDLANLPHTIRVSADPDRAARPVHIAVLPVRIRARRGRAAGADARAHRQRHPDGRRAARGTLRRDAPGRRRSSRRSTWSPRSTPSSARSSARSSASASTPPLRPLLARIPLLGYRFFDDTITPPTWGYVGALLAVPAAAARHLPGVAAPGADLAARRQPPRHTAARRGSGGCCHCSSASRVFIIPVLAEPNTSRGAPGLAVLAPDPGDDRAADRRTMADHGVRPAAGPVVRRRIPAAGRPPAGRQSACLVPGGQRPGARRHGRHDARRARPGGPRVAGHHPDQPAARRAPGRLPHRRRRQARPGRAAVGLPPRPGSRAAGPIGDDPRNDARPAVPPDRCQPSPGDPGQPFGGQDLVCVHRRTAAAGARDLPAGAAAVLVDGSAMYTDNLRALNEFLPFITPNSPVTTVDPFPPAAQ